MITPATLGGEGETWDAPVRGSGIVVKSSGTLRSTGAKTATTSERKRRTTREDGADSGTCPPRIRDALATFTGLRCTICRRKAHVQASEADDAFRR
ncbi:MAG TPA: hypothetical protein VN858_00920 [Casimicrobiaceae bacterium]|jgi:hypothetical protein|nr:hypothetical protein [Casimicrobiaceae bacterium]